MKPTTDSLIYYHFTDRSTLLRETLLRHVNDRAWHYTAGQLPADADTVRDTSIAWGELRVLGGLRQRVAG